MSTPTARELDDMFGALSSMARRRIMARLADGPATTPEIGREFSFTKQALNRHVHVLEQAGLIERRLDGRVKRIALVPQRLTTVSRWSDEIIAAWSANLDCLGDLLGDEVDVTTAERVGEQHAPTAPDRNPPTAHT